jgi:hypothetical protein
VIGANPGRRAALRAAREAIAVELLPGRNRGRHHHDAATTSDVCLRGSLHGAMLPAKAADAADMPAWLVMTQSLHGRRIARERIKFIHFA